ncbi:helix-turn-helix domain-containing protein [Marinicella sp. W31]|uniref:helix-turn-helix domain-containing protein n=1 Tax=Marinicella sp. W31 TaxID=3023713 RepID=UPI0037581F6F
MQFETHQIGAPYDQYVEAIFHYKGFVPDHSIERVVPTGHIFVLFELDDMVRHTFDNETLKPNAEYRGAWVSGMHRHYISISTHPDSEMFVIQFKPFGAHPFFHVPIENLNGQVISAEVLFAEELTAMRGALIEAATSAEKFQLAEAWLHRRFRQSLCPPQELLKLMDALYLEPAAKYQEIIEDYPNTQKHLIEQFKKYVGLTPKQLQRIIRFNSILQRIHQKEKIQWSDVAYECGFSDQSHFIKEFRHFSGFNPAEFMDKQHHQDEPNFFPLDR